MPPIRSSMRALRAGWVLAALVLLAAAPRARALEVRVTIGDLTPAVQSTAGGTVFEPSALAPGVVQLTGAFPDPARGRIVAGEDGLPLLMLEVPARGTNLRARIVSSRPGPALALAAPLLVVPPTPLGEGAPPAKRATPVALDALAPTVLHSTLAAARGATVAHVSVRIGSARAGRLEPVRELVLELALDPAPAASAERLPEVAARYARILGQTAPPIARGPWTMVPPAASTLAPTRDGGPVEVVIVTSEALRPEFERLAQFRTRLGYRAVVRTVEWIEAQERPESLPDRAARIRAFLADAHREWGTLWVLLAGDSEVIPARYAASSYFVSDVELIPADLYYAALDGDWNADGDAVFGEPADQVDLVPDLLLGRAPVSTRAEARAFVDRQLRQELGSGAEGAAPSAVPYPSSVLFLAEQLFESFDGAQVAEECRQLLPPSITTVRLYERSASYPGAAPESRESALQALNAGSGLVLHIGHGFRNALSTGSGSLSNGDADALENAPRLPIFLALNCTSAAIDFNSIGERLVKNARGGATVYIGSSRYAFPGTARHYQTTFFHAAFQDSLRTAGEAVARVRALLSPLGETEGAHRWTQFALTLLGDPMSPVFTRAPEPLVLRYPAEASAGATSIGLAVTAGGAPVLGARVALLAADGTLVQGFSDATGALDLPITAGAPGPYLVAASAPDTWPALGAVAVAGSTTDAFLAPGDLVMDLDPAGNRVAEPGETVILRVPVTNWGGATAAAGDVQLTVRSGDATLVDGVASLPALAPHTTIVTGPFELAIDPTAADGEQVTLDVEVVVGAGSAPARRALVIGGPRLRMAGRTIDGSGVVEPGTTVRWSLLLANDGSGGMTAVTASAHLVDAATGELATTGVMIDSTARFGNLRPGEVTLGEPFVFTLDPGADPADLALLVAVATSTERTVLPLIDFVAPVVPQGLHTRGSSSSVIVAWEPVADEDLLGYHLERAPAGSNAFVRITEHPVRSASFVDPDLPALTGFDYRVAAIDASGNESELSTIAAGTTSPALHPGWPIPVGQESASSIALVDLDGDGAAEILTGAEALYAWRGDGTELRDGDGTELTSGVFSLDGLTPGKGFHSLPAVANLDADPEPELVGAAWDAAQVFAWNRDGSRVSGWPQNVAGPPNWGSPAVGDLDGDGTPEIAVLCGANGAVYAWHADGSEVRDGDSNRLTLGILYASGAQYSFASPALADLDGVAGAEVVIGMDEAAGRLHALRATGGEAPGWPRALGGRISASPAIGDLIGGTAPEVVVAVEDDSVHVLTANGLPAPGWPQWAFVENAPTRSSSPVLADLDQDGRPEVIFAENSAPVHLAKLRVWKADGSTLPGFENVTFATDVEATGAGATQSTPVVGDVDGDGRLEILLGAEDGRLYGWNHDGTPVAGFPIQVGGEIRGSAAIGDVDGDGRVEVVALSWDKQVYVWDLDAPVQANLLPWPAFRRDAANSGNSLAAPPPSGSGPKDGAIAGAGAGAEPAVTRPALRAPAVLRAGDSATLEIVVGRPGSTRLRLCSVTGRIERELYAGELSAGRHALTFDGRAANGRPLAAGVYWFDLRGPGGTAAQRLLVWR